MFYCDSSCFFFRQLLSKLAERGTQRKSATCSELSAIWKCTSKIWGICIRCAIQQIEQVEFELNSVYSTAAVITYYSIQGSIQWLRQAWAWRLSPRECRLAQTVKQTEKESGSLLCGNFQVWLFLQSKFVNNVCKLPQLLETPQTLPGLRPWTSLQVGVPSRRPPGLQSPPQMKISVAATGSVCGGVYLWLIAASFWQRCVRLDQTYYSAMKLIVK